MFIRGGIVKRILLLLIAVLVMAGCNGGSGESSESSASRDRDDNCVYNNFYWGDDKEYVIAEKGEPVEYNSDGSIDYNEKFNDDESQVTYSFNDEKLYKIEVRVLDSVLEDDTEAMKSMLVEMYGEPLSEFLEDPDDMRFITCRWKKGNTDIELQLIDGFNGLYYIKYEKK